jgi:homocysteine S-methyltransferase
VNFIETLLEKDFILSEAAVIEACKRSDEVSLHPDLENALLIYDAAGRRVLSSLYCEFIAVAHDADVPVIICAPTWRAGSERLLEAGIKSDVNGDAVKFLKDLRGEWGPWQKNIFIGGLVGCKNDCYRPDMCLEQEAATAYHLQQIDRLVEAGADFLLAATLPAFTEAAGIAKAMERTGIPYIISFVIDRTGRILDGTSLAYAIDTIDSMCDNPPSGYMINCSYPSFLNASEQPESVFKRLIGFQANASSLDHSELDGSETLRVDEISDWGDRMLELYRKYCVKILGGCCGTGSAHLKYIVENIKGET